MGGGITRRLIGMSKSGFGGGVGLFKLQHSLPQGIPLTQHKRRKKRPKKAKIKFRSLQAILKEDRGKPFVSEVRLIKKGQAGWKPHKPRSQSRWLQP